MTPPPAPGDRPARTSRCWTLRGDEGVVDVEVTAADDHRVAEILPLLHRALGVPVPGLWSGSARLDPESPLSSAALRHGAVLGLGPSPGASPPSSAELRVAGGPDAGRRLPLGRGLHLVGRDSGCDVQLVDPDISRRHLELRVREGGVQVRDLASTNGSLLDDARLDGEFREWSPEASLRLGATTLAISHDPADRPAVLEPHVGGRSLIRPPHVLRGLREEREITLPRPPAEAPRRRLAWVAVLLPAAGGAVLAWLLHTPTFLFFALLSPLVALGTWASDRWSGRRSTRRERACYRDELAAAHAELQAAVRADIRAAERDHPDPATLAAAARRRTDLVWSRRSTGTDPLLVRVGSGPGSVRVTRLEDDGRPAREVAEHVPVCVDLTATGGLAVLGPRAQALGAVRAVLAQLVALHAPDGLHLVLLTTPARVADWTWARWLPHLPAGAVHVEHDGPGSSPGGGRSLRAALAGLVADRAAGPTVRSVVVVDRRVDGRTAAFLRAVGDAGVVCLTTAEQPAELPVAVDASLTLAGETATSGVLAQDRCADRTAVLVDHVSDDLAGEVARDLTDLVPACSDATLPTEVRLLELQGSSALPRPAREAVDRWPDDRDALRASLGRSADGPVLVDLCREGPHALVAGTTGSGKSELLQSLIAGLALNHPPERCSFLLVDYKGGAAFAEAARLPHTVGMLTDLDGSTTARALRSLSAELSRREALLAAHGVADLAALPATVPLARLVIVVDEFATLVEELPAFVPGLVGIAQRGRSLGIHLVLATQRPGGVVSPEIRANCTLRICLRTTDEADSRDVVGTAAAAHLPVHVPGRAFLRTGSGEPRLFQVARVALPVASAASGPDVRRWTWPRAGVRSGRPDPAGVTDLARLVDVLAHAAEVRGAPPPHRPWQPPLPDRLPQADLDATAPGHDDDHRADRVTTRFRIGLVDRPDRQAREPLDLDLAVGGGVLAVGGPRSGRTTFLRTVLRSATAQLEPEDLHVHVLETAGGELCSEAAALPHTGTAISGADAFRVVRLLDRLNREVDTRRAAPPGSPAPLVLVLVDGMEAAGALLDEAEPGRGPDGLLRLVRDGAAVGVTCVLTADRALPGGRVAAAARMRLLLPLPDRADYAVAGVPARDVPAHRPPGRALLGEDALECQLALPRSPTPRLGRGAGEAVRIVDLPPDPLLPSAPAAPSDLPGQRWRLAIGPGGDDGDPLEVDLHRSGGLLVLGPSRSGRTAALESFAVRLSAAGAEVIRLFPQHARPDEAATEPWLDAADPAALLGWVEGLRGRRGVLLADDLGSASEYAGLAALPRIGPRARVVLLAAGSPGQLASHYQGPVAALRRARTGLLLCPAPADAEALGIRLPRLPLPVRPGSGWLVTDGVPQRVQVARTPPAPRPAPDGRAPQSSSSAGPSSCVAYQASS